MLTFAFRSVLAAFILLKAVFWAVELSRHQEYVGNFFGGAGEPGIAVYCKPLWVIPAAVALGLLGFVLCALVAQRRGASTAESSLDDFSSGRWRRGPV
jgi:hypothetical protein